MDTARLYMQAWSAITQVHLGHWDAVAGPAMAVLERQGVSAISRIMALVALGRLRARRGDPGVCRGARRSAGTGDADRPSATPRSGSRRPCRGGVVIRQSRAVRAEAQAVFDLALSKRHPWLTGELGYWLWRAGEQVELPEWAARPFALQAGGAWRAAAAEWERLGCPYERAIALSRWRPRGEAGRPRAIRAAGRALRPRSWSGGG